MIAEGPRIAVWRFVGWEALFVAFAVWFVVVRLFTERIPVLPRALNGVDLVAAPAIFFVWAMISLFRRKSRVRGGPLFLISVIFLIGWALSWALNPEVHWMGALLLAAGILTPVLFYLTIINAMPDIIGRRRLQRTMLSLFWVNLAIGAVDIVTSLGAATHDVARGTFGANVNQFAFFVSMCCTYYVAKWRYESLSKNELAVLLLSIVVFLYARFQTLWVVLPIAIGCWFLLSGKLTRAWFRLVPFIGLTVVVSLLVLPRISSFNVIGEFERALGSFDDLQKVNMVRSLPEVWDSRPWGLLLGIGPGTFNSRAFRSIAIIPWDGDTSAADVAASVVEPFYSSPLADRFVLPYFLRGQYFFGGWETDSPFTSFVSVPAELGLWGAISVAAMYGSVMVHLLWTFRYGSSASAVPASWAFMTLTTLILLCVKDNFLEVTRYTLLAWLVSGIAYDVTTEQLLSDATADERPNGEHPRLGPGTSSAEAPLA